MKLLKEFKDFLREYKVITLALAFIMGAASNSLVKSLVDNIIMPFIEPVMPGDQWAQTTLNWGPFSIKWGAFLAESIHFLIIALLVFLIAKKILREEKVAKK